MTEQDSTTQVPVQDVTAAAPVSAQPTPEVVEPDEGTDLATDAANVEKAGEQIETTVKEDVAEDKPAVTETVDEVKHQVKGIFSQFGYAAHEVEFLVQELERQGLKIVKKVRAGL